MRRLHDDRIPRMLPVLPEMPPFTLYAYGTLVAAGLLVGGWYARRCAGRVGLYGLERAMLEFVREDPDSRLSLHGSESLMQPVSVALLGAEALLWSRRGAASLSLQTRATAGVPQGS